MANIPVYESSVQVQDPGQPQARIEPTPAAAAPTNIAQAQENLGKETQGLGSHLLMREVMLDRLEAQQQGYDQAAKAAQALNDKRIELEQRKGMDAKGAALEFRNFAEGTQAIPPGIPGRTTGTLDLPQRGKSATQGIVDQYAQGLGAKAMLSYVRTVNSHVTAGLSYLKEHEDKQVNQAMEENATTAMNDQIGLGNNIRSPEDLKTAQENLSKIFDDDLYWHTRGYPPNKLANMKQGFLDHQVEAAVQSNAPLGWQKAQNILDGANVSPMMKAHLQDNVINGARTGQTTDALTEAITNDKSGRFRTPTGEFDESKIQPFVDKALVNAKATGLPAGHDDIIAEKVRSSISMRNSEMDQEKKRTIEKSGNDIWNAFQQGVPSDQAYKQFIEQGHFDNAIERGKADDLFKKVYEHDPTALESVAEHWSPARKEAYDQVMASKEVNQKFPMSEDKKAFGDSLKQQIIEKNVQNRAGINQLLQDNLKTTPSGELRWPVNPVGWVAGREHTAQYADLAEAVQKNQPLVKAVGGTAQAIALAQNIGGVDKLAPDAEESKAVMALLQRGAKPEQIRSDSIEAVKTKHPEWLK